jgi:hypothetical protein
MTAPAKPDALEMLRDEPIGSDLYARAKPTSLLTGIKECVSALTARGGSTKNEIEAVAAYLGHAAQKIEGAIAAFEAERRENADRLSLARKQRDAFAAHICERRPAITERDAKIRRLADKIRYGGMEERIAAHEGLIILLDGAE